MMLIQDATNKMNQSETLVFALPITQSIYNYFANLARDKDCSEAGMLWLEIKTYKGTIIVLLPNDDQDDDEAEAVAARFRLVHNRRERIYVVRGTPVPWTRRQMDSAALGSDPRLMVEVDTPEE